MEGRRFTGDTLLIATHNPGKLREIEGLLSPWVAHFPSAASLGLPEPEETGKTFAENAVLKASAAARASGLPALADDSGLCIDALCGEPGVLSARWAGPDRDFGRAMQRILDLLGNRTERTASFQCTLCLAWPDGVHATFQGVLNGRIAENAGGRNGFGYDPIFIPEGKVGTLAMMGPAEKEIISHRTAAFEVFMKTCFERIRKC